MLLVLLIAMICKVAADCNLCTSSKQNMQCSNITMITIASCVPENTTHLIVYSGTIPFLDVHAISGLDKIKSLVIVRCGIRVVDKRSFQSNSLLETLSLSENRLSYLDDEIFHNNTALKNLNLSQNKLTRLSMLLLEPLKQLVNLIVNNNYLTSIVMQEIRYLPSTLGYIDLSSNYFTTLPAVTFSKTLQIQISLRNNPWKCDCDLWDFLQLIEKGSSVIMGTPVCASPLARKGILLTDLPDLCSGIL